MNNWMRDHKIELVTFAPIYFFLSIIELRTKLSLTDAWFDGILRNNHNLLLSFGYYNNEQSRLLQFLIPEFFRQAFALSIANAYILQRWLFVFIALVLFHFYLRHWFPTPASFAGVVFFAAIMPLTFMNDLQESGPLLLVMFLLGLWAIRDQNTRAMLITFFIGGLNSETTIFLVPVYFFYHWKPGTREFVRLCRDSLFLSLPLIVPLALIRWINRDRPHLTALWQLPDNLARITVALQTNPLLLYKAASLFIIFLFGALWVYAFFRWKRLPLFLHRASLLIPLFTLAHFLVGIVDEVRLFLPLTYLIVPMAWFFLFPVSPTETAREHP